MTTWTDIDSARLEPGKPIRSIDGLALRDNPIAIAEGAEGAPRIATKAFAGAVVGDVVSGGFLGVLASVNRSYPNGSGSSAELSSSGFNCLVGGNIRVSLQVTITRSASGTNASSSGYVELLKNGVRVSYRTSSGPISVDLPVAPGDSIRVRAYATANAGSSAYNGSASCTSMGSSTTISTNVGNFVGVML